MKIAVCGAGGFIGGHLVARLVREGHEVTAIDKKPLIEWLQSPIGSVSMRLDLSRPLHFYLRGYTQDHIFNLAADMGGMGFIEKNKALCMLSVLINTNLLQAARGVSRFFFSSSACVYNADKQKDPGLLPLREEDAYPAMPEDGYGWEKLFSERMCRHFTEDFGLETRVARYHNVYGPYGTYDGGREKAPAAICRKVIQAKLSGDRDMVIWGDGEQTRSFMYIDDCIEGTLRLMNSEVREPLNVGSSERVSINRLVDIVEEIAGIKLHRKYDLDAPKGVNGRNSDNTKIKSLLGWEPSIKLRDGMEKTYAWIYDQMKNK